MRATAEKRFLISAYRELPYASAHPNQRGHGLDGAGAVIRGATRRRPDVECSATARLGRHQLLGGVPEQPGASGGVEPECELTAGGAEPAVKYLTDHNIKMLRDEYVKIDDAFYLIGREDRSSTTFGGKHRKPLSQIVEGIDKTYPLILMDHQPVGLQEAVREMKRLVE